MTVNQLYTKLCPECRELFTCVSKAGRYCTDKCRNKAYRRRKKMARDGIINGVPKMYDFAIKLIADHEAKAFRALTDMEVCNAPSCAIKFAIIGMFHLLPSNLTDGLAEEYWQIQADSQKRKQTEFLKYVDDIEVA